MKIRDYNTDHSVAFTRDEIASALSKLDPSCDRGEWIKIGMATKSAGEDLFDVWNEWSKGSDKHNQSDAASAWKSFKGGKVTVATLVYLAQLAGWKNPRREQQGAKTAPAQRVKSASATLTDEKIQTEQRNKRAATLERNGFKIVAAYRYTDDFFIYRLENERKEKTFKPLTWFDGAWSNTTFEGLRPLFNLEGLQEADRDEEVFVVEGEKCSLSATSVGLLATTSSNGGQSADKSDWSSLRGRRVVIVPDRDKIGETYATSVEKNLRGLDCEVRIMRLSSTRQKETPEGFDISDWIDEHESSESTAIAAKLRSLAKEALVVSHKDGSSLLDDLQGFEKNLAATHGKEFLGLPSRYFPKLDQMLDGWRGFGVLAAEPGVGKTTLLLQVGLGIVAANPDACFVFFSFEMPRAPMLRRLACQLTKIPSRVLRKGNSEESVGFDGLMLSKEERARLVDGMKNLRKLAPRISLVELEDLGQVRGLSHEEIRDSMIQKVEAFKARSGCSKAFILVDHLAKVPLARDSRSSSLDVDEARVSILLEAQRRLDDALVVISQVRKSDFDKPNMASAKGSAEITYSPDFYITLSKKKDDEEPLGLVQRFREGAPRITYFDADLLKGRDEMERGRVSMQFIVDEQRIEEA